MRVARWEHRFQRIATVQNAGPDISAYTANPFLGVLLTWSVSPSHAWR
jgi:hypothetical protein